MYPAWYGDGWFNILSDDSPVNCTAKERASVLPHSLSVQIFEFISNHSAVADTGIVSKLLIDTMLCVYH